MDKQDFREFIKQRSDAFSRSLQASDSDRLERLKVEIDTLGETAEILAESKSFHVDAVLTDEFIDEVYQEIQGTRVKPVVQTPIY